MKHSKSHPHGAAPAVPDAAARSEAADAVERAATDLSTRLEELEAELARVRDERLRADAELQNVRRRAAREAVEAERRGETRAFGAFLTLIDDLERARAAAAGDEGSPLHAGVSLVLTRAMDELARLGVSPIDPEGEPFDPHAHEALLSAASESHPAGAVAQVISRGYRRGDRLLRPARVVVSTGQAGPEERG